MPNFEVSILLFGSRVLGTNMHGVLDILRCTKYGWQVRECRDQYSAQAFVPCQSMFSASPWLDDFKASIAYSSNYLVLQGC